MRVRTMADRYPHPIRSVARRCSWLLHIGLSSQSGDGVMVSLMEVCSSISHAPRAIIARHRFAAAIPALMIMPLVLSPQPSQAQGVCELLDQVVASATESTPFRSVRYLSAPQGKCQVAQDDEHEDMGAYIPAYSIIRKGEDIEYVDSWLCLWQDATLNQLWDEYERIDETAYAHGSGSINML